MSTKDDAIDPIGETDRSFFQKRFWPYLLDCERVSLSANCPANFGKLISDCLQVDPTRRPTIQKIVGLLLAMGVKEEVPGLIPANASALNLFHQANQLIGSQCSEFLPYLPPYLTDYPLEEGSDRFWKLRRERAQEDTQLVGIEKIHEDFLKNEDAAILVLVGESGLGKTLSLEKLAYDLLKESMRRWDCSQPFILSTLYFPVLVRPTLSQWTHEELKDGLAKSLRAHGMSPSSVASMRFLFLLDAYDECLGVPAPNLPEHLGFKDFPGAKMIVTCRPDMAERQNIGAHFGRSDPSSLWVRYFVPFNCSQVNDYLAATLRPDACAHLHTLLEESGTLRAVLRNPFVLSLFVKSWETSSQKDPQQLTRRSIYESFVAHWIQTQSFFLEETVREDLKGRYPTLEASFRAFASHIALKAFGSKRMSLEMAEIPPHFISWLSLEEKVKEECHTKFAQRVSHHRRFLLTFEDWETISLHRLRRFWELSPLKKRQSIAGPVEEFVHRSFFEYFLAEALLTLSNEAEGYGSLVPMLNAHPIQEEAEVLTFIKEAWKEGKGPEHLRGLQEGLWRMIERSKETADFPQASANAATILNAMGLSFSGKDLKRVKLIGADLRGGLFEATNFEEAELRDVNFRGAWLNHAKFRGALMERVDFGERPTLRTVGEINDVCYSPEGLRVAVITNHTLRELMILNHPLGEPIPSVLLPTFGYKGERMALRPNKQIKVTAFHPHKAVIAITESDFDLGPENSIGLWDGEARVHRRLQEVPVDREPGIVIQLQSIVFNQSGSYIAAAGSGYPIRLWDEFGQHIKDLKATSVNLLAFYTYCLAFSPDSQKLVSGGGGDLLEKGRFGKPMLRLWDIASAKCLWEKPSISVVSIAFEPKGEKIAAATSDKIQLWTAEGQCLQTLPLASGCYGPHLSFSPNGQLLASSNTCNGNISLWDVKTGEVYQELEGEPGKAWRTAPIFSPNGYEIALGTTRGIHFWNIRTLRALGSTSAEPTSQECGNTPYSVAVSPNGEIVASGHGDHSARLWEMATGKLIHSFKGHSNVIWSVAFNGDGTLLATGSHDQTIRLWDLSTRKLMRILQGHEVRSMTFFARNVDGRDQECLLSGGGSDKPLHVWDVREGRELTPPIDHKGEVQSLACSAEGKWIVTGGTSGLMAMQDFQQPWGKIPSFYRDEEGKWIRPGGVNGLTVMKSPAQLLRDNPGERGWKMFNDFCQDTVYRGEKRQGFGRRIVFHPKGDMFASAHEYKAVYLWRSYKDGWRPDKLCAGHEHFISSVAFDSSGETLASAGCNNSVHIGGCEYKICLWDTRTGQFKEVIEGFLREQVIYSLCFDPTGNFLVASCSDMSIRCWRLKGHGVLNTYLLWKTAQTKTYQILLNANHADFTQVPDLSSDNKKLLKQRGARISE